MSCLFCRIALRELPSAQVYEDEDVFGFLDINPLRTGHALLVPKRHAPKLEDLSPEDAAALFRVAQRVTKSLCQATGNPDATLAVNDGPAAGQEVPHVHLHIVPRQAGDGAGPIHALFAEGRRPRPSPDDLNDLAVEVQTLLADRPAKASAPGGHA